MRALLLLPLGILPLAAGAASVTGVPAASDQKADFPLGVEIVTSYRSEYVYRGQFLGHDILDVQIEAEIALHDHWFLSLGAWYATATGDDDFTQTSAFADLRYDLPQWSFGVNAGYQAYDHTFLEDGFDLGAYAIWRPGEDFGVTCGACYDTGADAWYAKIEGSWSKATGRNHFLEAVAGVSWADDYYGTSGWNDTYARLSWTYSVNDNVSFTPFLGTSVPLDSNPEKNRIFAGLWFAVSF